MKTTEKMYKIILETYQEIYAVSTPKADFMKVWKKYGDKQFFDKYTVDESKVLDILQGIKIKHKLTKYEFEKLKVTIYLGACPMFKKRL